MPRSRAAPAPARSSARAEARPRPAASSSSQTQSQATATPQSGGWFSSAPRPSAPPPAPHASSAPPAQYAPSSGGGMMSGLMGSVMTGAAMGTGSAIAHRAVDSMMGPRETRVVHEHEGAPAAAPAPLPAAQNGDGPCGESVKLFADCMSRYHGDMGACQPYFDAMQQCKTRFAV